MTPDMTLAQRAVLSVVYEHGASMIAARTSRVANTVHVSAARALVRAGVLVEQLGPDGVFVSRPCRLFALCSEPAVGMAQLVFADVSGCQRCADRLELPLVPFAGAAR